MTEQEATQAAKERSRHEVIGVYYDPDWPTPDWRDRYVARRYLNRPAHGTLIASYYVGALLLLCPL